MIAWALDHRWSMVLLTVASFAGAIALQMTAGGSGFVPQRARSELDITLETPPGSNLDDTRPGPDGKGHGKPHPGELEEPVLVGGAPGRAGPDHASHS